MPVRSETRNQQNKRFIALEVFEGSDARVELMKFGVLRKTGGWGQQKKNGAAEHSIDNKQQNKLGGESEKHSPVLSRPSALLAAWTGNALIDLMNTQILSR